MSEEGHAAGYESRFGRGAGMAWLPVPGSSGMGHGIVDGETDHGDARQLSWRDRIRLATARLTRLAANSVPQTNRSSGPKVAAEARPTK